MHPSAAPAPSPASRNFAGVLMDLASPPPKRPPARDLDGLEDDIATLNYEQALQAHARYRPPAADLGPQPVPEPPAATPASAPAIATLRRKSESITVRLSQAESERLRQRAAESGLTISDYLRSCVFEVESLRAQVKETIAALRALQAHNSRRPAWLRWLASRQTPRASA
ncbi:MAG: plasmid mobilization protein [Acidobacteriota bacterium]